jgi:hypothetical protein
MFQLKTLSKDAVPRSLKKAERYRLLNEPSEAESICLDVLQIDPENQEALITMLLALTDQFDTHLGVAVGQAEEILPRLHGEFERAYYTGIISERRAKARLRDGAPGAGAAAYDWLRRALDWYEKAEALCPPGNDDATLRWNACARLIMRNSHLRPRPEEWVEPPLE